MALLYCDGFDHYGDAGGAADLIEGGWIGQADNSNPLNITAKTSAVPIASGQGVLYSFGSTIWRSIGADPTKIVSEMFVGVAFYLPDYANYTGQTRDLLNFYSPVGNNNGQGVMLQIRIGGDGQLRAVIPSHATYTGTDVYTPGQWYYLEVHWKASTNDSTADGTIELRMDGIVCNGLSKIANAITVSNSSQNSNQIKFIQMLDRNFGTGGNAAYMDDLYICDATGSVNNTYLGPIRVNTLAPDGDTGSQDWTPTPNGTSFDKINGLAPDDDNTYLTASASGNISEFTIEDLDPAVTTVYGTMAFYRSRRTDVGTAKMKMSIKQSTTAADGAERQPLQKYRNNYDIHEVDPVSGVAFTPTDINSLTLMFTRTS